MQDTAREQLEKVIFPFWLEHGIDHRHGGFFTCFDNRGRTLLSADKFTWSQGRFVWLLARAADLARRSLLGLDAERLLDLARAGARFLTDHAVRDDGTCQYVVTRQGTAAAGPTGETQSVYADCFVAMGLSELARVAGDASWLSPAAHIVYRASVDIESRQAATPPYPVPKGFTAFGPRMILLNTLLEYVRARRDLDQLEPADVDALRSARTAMLRHRLDDGTFQEMVPDEPDDASFIARHRVPGHAIEGLWMALEAGELMGGTDDVPALLDSIDALCASAWDAEYGGLLRYVDASGAVAPDGISSGTPYEALVRRTWSTKLWWVHTESAYTAALAAHRYGHRASAEWFERVWPYTLETFPAGDDGEEWIHIRDREGQPLDEVVALPVKDPFHISRNLMQIVELDTQT